MSQQTSSHGAIAVKSIEDGYVLLHASADPGGNYGTLCGVSTDDDMFVVIETPKDARINCAHCHAVWQAAGTFNHDDFAPKAQRKTR